MKLVLFINSLAGGGAERVLSNLANHWARDGHQVLLVTLAEQSEDVYSVDQSVKRVSLHASSAAASPLHAIANNVKRIMRLRTLLKQQRPSCLVAFMSTANVLAIIACTGLSIPVIGSERIYLPDAGLPATREFTQRLTYRHAATIVAQTERNAAWIRAHLNCNVEVIPNSVSLPLPTAAPIIPPSELIEPALKVVLCVGRLADQKQVDHAIEAFAKVAPSGWHLVIIGKGDRATELRDLAAKLRIDCTFISHVGNIEAWYQRADVYVLSSSYEGFPNTLLEAMACGCAVIAYDCPTGPADMIQHGESGFLLSLNDKTELAEAIKKLTADTALRERLSANALRVIDEFSEARVFSRWNALLEKVANS